MIKIGLLILGGIVIWVLLFTVLSIIDNPCSGKLKGYFKFSGHCSRAAAKRCSSPSAPRNNGRSGKKSVN
jgi:hypothetical protein